MLLGLEIFANPLGYEVYGSKKLLDRNANSTMEINTKPAVKSLVYMRNLEDDASVLVLPTVIQKSDILWFARWLAVPLMLSCSRDPISLLAASRTFVLFQSCEHTDILHPIRFYTCFE